MPEILTEKAKNIAALNDKKSIIVEHQIEIEQEALAFATHMMSFTLSDFGFGKYTQANPERICDSLGVEAGARLVASAQYVQIEYLKSCAPWIENRNKLTVLDKEISRLQYEE